MMRRGAAVGSAQTGIERSIPEAGRGLVLVEPLASQRGGHPHQSLPLLVRAATGDRRPVVLVAVHGVDEQIRSALQGYDVQVLERPSGFGFGSVQLWLARALNFGYRHLHRSLPRRALPHQLELFSRSLTEAASLRIGREALGPTASTAVVLTANVTLHGLAAMLAGVPHLRYLHDLSRDESRAVRLAERIARRSLPNICILCTTPAIEASLRERYPTIRTVVQTYALDDPDAALRKGERSRARQRLGLGEQDTVASVIGGWWRVKDIATVVEAMPHATASFTLLIAGYRMDEDVLRRIADGHRGRTKVIAGQLSSAELRDVYAASDFTIVSRVPGGKESGVALDALSRGVPIVISDHDPDLTAKLRGQAWARIFRCGDPRCLAAAIDDMCSRARRRPPPRVATKLGMVQADVMLQAFDNAAERVLRA